MSEVHKAERGDSPMEFINNARELEEHTLKKTKRFPKSYRFIISNDLVAYSKRIYNDVLAANEESLKDARSYYKRQDYLDDAKNTTKIFGAQLTVARKVIGQWENNEKIESSMWEEWGGMINNEYKLLKGLIKKEKDQYGDLYKK